MSDKIERIPERLPDFYRYAVFVIYAVVIAQSFPLVTDIFIPYTNVLSFDGFENALTLILVYFFVVTSWIGYFKSITHRPHSENKYGLTRFGLDLFLIYQFYYMVNLIPNKSYHGDIFVWSFPAIFVTFLVWDIVKYYEFKKESKLERVNRKNRLVVTLLTLVPFVGVAVTYYYLIPIHPLIYNTNNVWNIIFIVISFVIIFAYRWKKWNHPKRKNRKTTK